MRYASAFLGPVRGIHLFSPAGDVSGVAVLKNGDAQVYFSSPLNSFGTNLDYPVLTIAMPVLPSATIGKKMNLVLDGINSTWLDPSSKPYPVELKSGVLTIGGSISVSDVVPGAGVVPAGTPITISGVGFPPDAVVQVERASVSSFQFVSANTDSHHLERCNGPGEQAHPREKALNERDRDVLLIPAHHGGRHKYARADGVELPLVFESHLDVGVLQLRCEWQRIHRLGAPESNGGGGYGKAGTSQQQGHPHCNEVGSAAWTKRHGARHERVFCEGGYGHEVASDVAGCDPDARYDGR